MGDNLVGSDLKGDMREAFFVAILARHFLQRIGRFLVKRLNVHNSHLRPEILQTSFSKLEEASYVQGAFELRLRDKVVARYFLIWQFPNLSRVDVQALGNLKKKVLPRPNSLSNQTFPPCA